VLLPIRDVGKVLAVLGSDPNRISRALPHSVLRKRVAGNNNPVGVFEFHFKTTWDDDSDVPATAVEWYDSTGSGLLDRYQKRADIPTHFMVDAIYSNGTIGTTRYRMSKHEVRAVAENSSDMSDHHSRSLTSSSARRM
jgi:hypothetical protein